MKKYQFHFLALLAAAAIFPSVGFAATGKPNIVIIWGDDIGYWNISAYNQGMMEIQDPQH